MKPENIWKHYKVDPWGCWIWQRAKVRGYGHLGHKGQQMRAHRVAWALANGPIPKGWWVLHKCDQPSCINPDHLYLGTHADNMADKVARGRVLKGEENGNAKLTWKDVEIIRGLLKKGVAGQEIASRYGVGKSQISKIKHYRQWKEK